MKNWKTILATIFALLVPAIVMAAAQVSTVNPTVPAQNSPLLSSVIRGNALATYNDINQLFANTYVTGNQILGNASAGQAVGLTIPSCSTGTSALTWTTSSGFGCNSAIGGGITALTQDVIASGSGSVAATLANTSTARNDLGLGSSATVNIGTAGAAIGLLNGANTNSAVNTFTAITKHDLNSAPLTTPATGTILQLGNADTTVSRIEVDGYGAAGHYTVASYGGTAASPTALLSSTTVPTASFNFFGYNGTSLVGPQAGMREYATQNWSAGSNGTQLDFAVTPNGSSTLTQAMLISQDGGVTLGSPTGADKGASTINAAGGVWSNGTQLQNGNLVAGTNVTITGSWPNQTINATTTGGGGGGALSALTGATTGNNIDNAANAQTWTWNTLSTGTGLTLSSTSVTTGSLLSLQDTAIAGTSTGPVLSISDTTTGAGYGVFSTMSSTTTGTGVYGAVTGASNTGYGVYGSNASATGYGVYSNGAMLSTGSIYALNQSSAIFGAAGGNLRIIAQPGGGSAGNLTLLGAAGGAGTNHNGGPVQITAGNGGTTTSLGGAIQITAGNGGTTSGAAGNVIITPGTATSGGAGIIDMAGGIVSEGTKFTASGCSISSTTGGAQAGVFTVGANTCTAVVTLNGATGAPAPNGWACFSHDQTAPLILISQTSSTTTTVSFSIPSTAGATDVIEFGCMGY